MEQVTSWLKAAAFMTESAHMILQNQQLLIFLIEEGPRQLPSRIPHIICEDPRIHKQRDCPSAGSAHIHGHQPW